MIDEFREENAALYALGLLEGPDLDAFEAALARDGALRRRVAELTETAASLALLAPAADPPRALRERILASVGTGGRRQDRRTRILKFPALLPWAAAACLAVAAGWLGQLYLTARSENAVLGDQRRIAELELRSMRNRMEAGQIVGGRQVADMNEQLSQARKAVINTAERLAAFVTADGRSRLKIATLTAMPGTSSQSLAVAVWDPAMQQGMLEVAKLPAPPPDKDYQLWVIDPSHPTPVNGGVFRVDPVSCQACVAFRPAERIGRAAKFAVSLERRGGVPRREGPIVLFGD